jgi:hypothetical protein
MEVWDLCWQTTVIHENSIGAPDEKKGNYELLNNYVIRVQSTLVSNSLALHYHVIRVQSTIVVCLRWRM